MDLSHLAALTSPDEKTRAATYPRISPLCLQHPILSCSPRESCHPSYLESQPSPPVVTVSDSFERNVIRWTGPQKPNALAPVR